MILIVKTHVFQLAVYCDCNSLVPFPICIYQHLLTVRIHCTRTNHPPSVLWHCWLGHQTCKKPSAV